MTTKTKMMIRPEVDRSDVQAIAWTAFGSLKGASYMLLRVIEPHAARQWLRGLAPASLHDLSVADVKKNVEGVKKNGGETYQIAFTAAGLLALGIDETIVKRFSPEFVEGMASNENRSRRLGDTGANAPTNWSWGVGDKEPHILLILLSSDADRLETFVTKMREQAEAAGLSKIVVLPTSDMGKVEPFGFGAGG